MPYCCCCPEEKSGNSSRGIGGTEDHEGLFSPTGLRSNLIDFIPSPFSYETTLRQQDAGGSKCKRVGFPEDSAYPSDTRSDFAAKTPVYRGGQNKALEYLDKSVHHGISGNLSTPWTSVYYTDGTWYEWDGVTTKSPFIVDTATAAEKAAHRADWYNWLFPGDANGNYAIRGLKQLYESTLPFADEYNPTPSELERWNDLVINHFRTLLGLNPAVPMQELFIRSKWSDERKTTSLWDTSYPGTLDSAYGPCIGGTNTHCGSLFVPGYSDQLPYWNDWNYNYPCFPEHPEIGTYAESEAIGTWWNGTAVTSMSRVLRNLVRNGNTSGHAGPFLFRPYYGYSIGGVSATNLRSKWIGPIQGPPAGYVIA